MKKLNPILQLGIALLTVLAFATPSLGGKASPKAESSVNNENYKIRWVLAHEPVAVFQRAADKFAALVSEKTNGKVIVDVINGKDFFKTKPNEDVSSFRVVKALQKGELEMSQVYTTNMGPISKNFWILDLPYLFKDHDHAAKALDGKIGQRIFAGIEKKNLKGLAFTYSGGYRIIPTSKREIHELSDFKGLKVRVSGSPVPKAIFSKLGASGVPLTLFQGVEATEKGTIDGTEITYSRFWSHGHPNAAKVINETNHSLFLTSVLVNNKFFEKLPVQYQTALQESALEMAKMERADSVADGELAKKKAIDHGIKVVTLKAGEKEKLRAALMPIYKDFESKVDSTIISDIQALN